MTAPAYLDTHHAIVGSSGADKIVTAKTARAAPTNLDQVRVDVEFHLLRGSTLQAAANRTGIAVSSVHKIGEDLRERLKAEGKRIPPGLRRRQASQKPKPPAEVRTIMRPVPVLSRPVVRLSFEEQLARVAAGAAIATKFTPPRSAPDITLGGVASSLL
jgi:hypothetical protein